MPKGGVAQQSGRSRGLGRNSRRNVQDHAGVAARGRGEMEHSGCPAVTPTLRDLDQPNDSSYVRELALRGRQAVSVDHWV
jgi:hypothetical protein